MIRLSSLFLVSLPLLCQDTAGVGSIAGSIRGGAGEAIAGTTVCVNPGDRCAVSDSAGRFRVNDLRPGAYEMEVRRANDPSRREKVEVRAGITSEFDIVLPALDEQRQEVTVTAPAFVAPEEVKTSSYLVTPREVLKTAGSLQDVSRYVQTLPGVVIGGLDFRNDIIVRGGSPLENLFIVDNVEIPNINNFANFASAGGPVSMIDSELIEDVTFLTGGFPAPYVNRLSSVMQIATREGSREKIRKRATVGFAGAGGIVEGPLTPKGSWIVSARRSFLDLFTDDIGFGGVPVNNSFNSKALYDLNSRNRVWVVNITGFDNIRIRPDGVKEEQQTNTFNIDYDGWRSATGFNWQRLFGSRGVGLFGLTHSVANVSANVGDQLLANARVYGENSREHETTLKYDLTLHAPVLDKIRLGGNFKIFQLNYRADQPLGNDNPFSTAPGRVNVFGIRQRFNASQSSGYVQASRDITPRLSISYGGRADNYQYIGATRFSPRAGLNFRAAPRVMLRGSWGIYYQQPFFLVLAADPVNRGLSPIRADHLVGGVAVTLTSTMRFTVETYRKRYRAYPAAIEYPQFSLANAGDTFAVRNLLFPMASGGRGEARGVEFFVEKKFTRKLYGQSNFAITRTRHAGLDGVLRPGSFDYPRIFNLVGGYKFNEKWEAGMRFVALSGRPYTPFNEALSRLYRRGVFDLDRVNGVRAPYYSRFDFRVDRTFQTRWGPLNVFVGLQNAFNRDNFQALQWNRRANQPKFDTQLGSFPLIGLDWRF